MFSEAARRGVITVVDMLIAHAPQLDINRITHFNGGPSFTPLKWAIRGMHTAVISRMLADPRLVVRDNGANEMFAAVGKRFSCFINNDPPCSENDQTRLDVLQLLLQDTRFQIDARDFLTQMTVLHYAVWEGRTDIAYFLLESGLVNVNSHSGVEAILHTAMRRKMDDISRVLLRCPGIQVQPDSLIRRVCRVHLSSQQCL